MSNRQLVQETQIGAETCSFFMHGQAPVVEYNQQTYPFLWSLLQDIPQLCETTHLTHFAKISNFYWKAGNFQFIDSIEEYQKFYLARVKFEQDNPADLFEFRLTDFKIFDVSVMHPPEVENEQLSYFTYNKLTFIPYRVVCPFPYHLQQNVHYQILPIIE